MNLSPGALAALIVPLAFAGFAAFWCLICFFIARSGGWHALATRFPVGPYTPHGVQWFNWQTMYMEGADYRGSVNIGVGPNGLYLSAMALFSVGHARICIPWSAIQVVQVNNRRWVTYYVLAVALENRSPIQMRLYGKGLVNAIAPHLTPVAGPMR